MKTEQIQLYNNTYTVPAEAGGFLVTCPGCGAQLVSYTHLDVYKRQAAQYLQCQMRFSMMMADVYKILAEVSDLGIDQMIGGDK